MTAHSPAPFTPAMLSRAITEWVGKGYAVKLAPDGTLTVEPSRQNPDNDSFDLVDMRR